MAEQELKLQESLNSVDIEGTLEEKDIKIVEGTYKTGDRKGEDYRKIQGKLVIRTSDTDTHTVKIEANEKTSTGKDNAMFKGYETIMNTYKSLAEIKESGEEEEEPAVVSVQGQFDINDYFSAQKDEMKSIVEVKGKFINQVTNPDKKKYKARFDVEFYIGEIKKEKDKDKEETGRLLVKGYIVKYGSKVFPVEFIVTDKDEVAEFFYDKFNVGDTVNMWGDLVNSAITTTKEKKGFGNKNTKVTNTYKHEIVIDGGDEDAYEGEKAYDSSIIKKAIAERKAYLEDKEAKDREYAANKNKKDDKTTKKGFGNKDKNKSASKKSEDVEVEINEEEIPF